MHPRRSQTPGPSRGPPNVENCAPPQRKRRSSLPSNIEHPGQVVRVISRTRRNEPLGGTPNQQRRRVYFYDRQDPFYGFTNFSPHQVEYQGKVYPTSEHLFQSLKFLTCRPHLAEHIRTFSNRPSVAFSEARRFGPEVRPDWRDVNIQKMEEALFHKFNQHAELKAQLLGTRDAELIENSPKDAFWGIGSDGKGRNELGKALERLRAQLWQS